MGLPECIVLFSGSISTILFCKSHFLLKIYDRKTSASLNWQLHKTVFSYRQFPNTVRLDIPVPATP